MKLALGTVQFGMDYGVQGAGQPKEKAVEEMLSYALGKGITHFDTASAYGNAEEVLGRYIEKAPDTVSSKMRIISKLSPGAFLEKPGRIWKDIVLDHIRESLTRLNCSRLEAFLFHNAEYIFDENAVHALYGACQENLSEKIGVSIYTPQEALKALEYEEIKVIQIPYNVFDQRLDRCGFFEQAKKKGVEVYARSTLLQGLMLMEPGHLPENVRFAERYLGRFREICEEYGVSPLKAAVGYVTGHPGIDYVVFGVDNKKQLAEYISMEEEKIPEDMISAFQKEFEEVEEKLVNPARWNQ